MAKSPNKNKTYDIIISGGGPAGLTLACVLGTHGFSVLCLDREKSADTFKSDFDGRTIAISFGSHNVLREAKVWDQIQPLSCPINHIKILDGTSPVLLNFLSEEVGGRAFGNIVEMRHLREQLHKRIGALPNVTHLSPVTVSGINTGDNIASVTTGDGQTYYASLLIGADGRQSVLRKHLNIPTHGWEYDQTAIVCVVEHEHPHNNEAVEHFRKEGPFAILPMLDGEKKKHRSSLVWTVHGNDAASFLDCADDVFNAALAARFPENYGQVKLASKRFSYPLSLQHAHSYVGERIALIADAAHGMHPIAGQGLNMGMRDIAALSDLLNEARDMDDDLGSAPILRRYQRARHFDNMMMMAATDGLNKLFSNSLPVLGHLRRIGVALVDRIPTAKSFFMNQAMGIAGQVPDKMKTIVKDDQWKSRRTARRK